MTLDKRICRIGGVDVRVPPPATLTAQPYEPVTYCYTVTNTGGKTLNNILIRDDNGTPNFLADDFIVHYHVAAVARCEPVLPGHGRPGRHDDRDCQRGSRHRRGGHCRHEPAWHDRTVPRRERVHQGHLPPGLRNQRQHLRHRRHRVAGRPQVRQFDRQRQDWSSACSTTTATWSSTSTSTPSRRGRGSPGPRRAGPVPTRIRRDTARWDRSVVKAK